MKGEIRNSWFDSETYDTSTNGKKEFLSILPDKKIFNTPKPVNLYKEIIKMAISPKVEKPVILDFLQDLEQQDKQYQKNLEEKMQNLYYVTAMKITYVQK